MTFNYSKKNKFSGAYAPILKKTTYRRTRFLNDRQLRRLRLAAIYLSFKKLIFFLLNSKVGQTD
jgi:hypothetical protein